MLSRTLYQKILDHLIAGKVLVLMGPRRVGKTVLIKKLADQFYKSVLFLNGEEQPTRKTLQSFSLTEYKQLIGDKKLLIIDEAQTVAGIGRALKLIVDQMPKLKVVVTGSSQFDMLNEVGEPLTGRKNTIMLYPISIKEYLDHEGLITMKGKLEQRMIYGNYPELLQMETAIKKENYLKELTRDYLLKDILVFDSIRNSEKIYKLLQLIAFQVGQEVSMEELGRQLGMSKNTVEKYLDLLHRVFVLYKVSGFSRNLRKEVVKNSKWYFYDNGVRNALINNFNTIDLRQDQGQLWENFVIGERIKHLSYNDMHTSTYFWRTYDRQEIDWIEERNGAINAYEMKWQHKKVKTPGAWAKHYPEADFRVISQDNYLEWIL